MADSSGPAWGRFATTQWSLVLAAGAGGEASQAREALAALCATYWRPLYYFARRQGCDPAEAADMTQGFFAALLEKNTLSVADRERGRFRSFLIGALKHFMSHEWERARAQKRGGGKLLSLDFDSAERGYRHEPAHRLTSERLFERQWALAMLEQALDDLGDEQSAAGKLEQWALLRPFLSPGASAPPYSELAERTGSSAGSLKITVHRLRQRFGQLLRYRIAQTVVEADEVDEEIRLLFSALAVAEPA